MARGGGVKMDMSTMPSPGKGTQSPGG